MNFHQQLQEWRAQTNPEPPTAALFAKNTSDALACKEAALEGYRLVFSDRATLLRDGRTRPPEELAAINQIRQYYADDYRQLPDLPVFFWSDATATVVREASKSYPLPDFDNAPFMSAWGKNGFAVFESPILGALIDGIDATFSAVSWSSSLAVNHNRWPVISIIGYHWTGSMCTPVWWASIGAHWLEMPADPTFIDEQKTVLQWLLTAIMFIEQSIVESSTVRLGGQIGKRAERANLSRDVHVVSLRKVIRQKADSDTESSKREWDHRWMVSGHWRRQWYPKAERNVPIYIHPYIKGPEDKPLKTPTATVFAVTR